ARRGDLALAKKWIDVSNRMIAAYRRLEDMATHNTFESEEELRADIRARIARYVSTEQDLERWEWRRDIWSEMAAEAARLGLPSPKPMPPRPQTWRDKLPEDLRQRYVAQEQDAQQEGADAGDEKPA